MGAAPGPAFETDDGRRLQEVAMIGRRRSLAMMLAAGALAFAGSLAAQESAVTPAPEPRAGAGEGRGGVWPGPTLTASRCISGPTRS